MGNLLSIGQSGLLAAQVGLATTGNNITNASVAGYSRQEVVQSDQASENYGYGFVGNGTQVSSIKRYYDDFLNTQLLSAQASQAQTNSYSTQINQVDNLLSDTTAGLSPALSDFFNSVQNVNGGASTDASRQALLSSASSLVSRFQEMSQQLSDLSSGVNTQIVSSVAQINTYTSQSAVLNQQIAGLSHDPNNLPNDLLDQRNEVLSQLNQIVKTTSTTDKNNMLSVSMGSGQSLVVGNTAYTLATTSSPTDASQVSIGYQTNSGIVNPMSDSTFNGGQLGGLMQFRDSSLNQAQNGLGQMAAGLASAFNAQHALGQDQNGAPGGAFFGPSNAYVGPNAHNSALSTAQVSATVTDASALTTSDYAVDYDGTNFTVTRASDGQKTVINPYPQTVPQVIDGVSYTITGTPQPKDNFAVRPTYLAASDMSLLISDPTKVALAAPIVTGALLSNTGKGAISQGSVDPNYLTPGNALTTATAVTLSYDKASNTLSGFPAGQDVTVTVNGTPTVYPAGTPSIPYTDGEQLSFGGVNVTMTGQPGDTDQFTIGPNSAGVGDNRNGALLGALQSTKIMNGNNATFQTTYAQLVNGIGNSAAEANIASTADDAAVTAATNQQQAISGVNLDEEASNLLQYQQAYQASGKVMQIASQLFSVLLSLGSA